MKKLLVACLLCASVIGLAFGQAKAASKTTVIVASSVDANPQNYTNVFYNKFIELAQQYSDNAFDFQFFPSMQLGDEQETVRGIQLGTIHIANLATNNYAPFAPSCGWVNMPYMFDSLEEFRALVDAMWDQNNEWAIKEGGCRLLCILDIGYRQLTTSAKHPVRKLADAKGIKIRTPQNALMVSTFKALGLEPTAVSFAETFNALQQGVVDGQENPTNGINIPLKIWDYHKFHCDWHYIIDPLMLGVNPRVWKSFSPEDQKLLLECAAETEKYGKALSRLGMDDGSALAYLKSINKLPETTDCYAVMEANGMTVSRLSNEQIAALAKATEGVRKDWTAKIGADLVKAAEEDMASVR